MEDLERSLGGIAPYIVSNIISLGFVHDMAFVRRYLQETRDYILPHAAAVSPDMYRELSDLVENRDRLLSLLAAGPVDDDQSRS